MSEDLTKKLPQSDSEKISLILTTVQHLETRVDKLEQRFDSLENKVDSLENKVEERLYDTRPIWEKVVADIALLQEGQLRLEGNVGEIKISVRDIYRRMSLLNDNMLKTQSDVIEINERLERLEQRQQDQSKPQT